VNRALRAATMGALLLSPIALAACSSGQVTQTATQDRDKSGPQAEVENITLRSVVLESPSGGRYDEGDDAELTAAIVNNGNEPDTLVSIEGEDFEGIRAIGGDTQAVSDSAGFSTELNLEIPPDAPVYLGEDGPTILLENLSRSLTSSQSIELTMTFENAGEVPVRALVDTPAEEVPRGEAFDYHQEEQEGETDEREASSGAGQGE
jgi:copper(I)-binding protein